MATTLTVSRMPLRLSPVAAYLLSPPAVLLATWALFGLQQAVMRAEGGAYVRPFGIGFLVIVAVMTMLGGLGPGLWTLALSLLSMAYFLLPTAFSSAIRQPRDWVEFALLLLAGTVVVIGMEAMRRNRGLLESAQKAETQERFLAETIPQLVWTATPDGAVDYFNRHWHEYTGTTLEQPEGSGDVTHPDDQARMAAHWAESLKTGDPYEVEYRLRRASDGAYRWFIARALPLRDSAGRIVRWFGTCTDIHDQKMFAAALEAGETRKAAILESALDCIVTMDHAGNVLEWNPAAEKTFGHRREDAVGKPVADLIVPPSLRQAHRDGLAHYLATGEGPVLGQRIEVPALRADGTEFPSELAISSAQIDGQPLFTAYLRDISTQKASEQEVQRLLGEAQARAERESLVNQIGQTIRASLAPEEIQAVAARALGEALGADRCYFADYDVPRDFCRVEQDWRAPSLPSLAGEYRLSDFAADTKGIYQDGTVVIEDFQTALLPPETVSLLEGLHLRAIIAVPLLHEGRLVSVLTAAMADKPRAWTAEEVALVETVAVQTRSTVDAAAVRRREHHIAEALQDALMPALRERVSGLQIDSFYKAALEEASVGGDFFDVFNIEKGCVAVVIGDLSGKGLAAAAQVATVRNMLRYALYRDQTLVEAMGELNKIMIDNSLLAGFATLFVGVFDQGLRTLTYVSCGHEPGLIRRRAGGPIEELPATGPVLGIAPHAPFEETTLSLFPGDALVLYTDGVSESGLNRSHLLGVPGIISLLQAEPPGQSAHAVIAHLMDGVRAHAQDRQHDDVCLIAAVVEAADARSERSAHSAAP